MSWNLEHMELQQDQNVMWLDDCSLADASHICYDARATASTLPKRMGHMKSAAFYLRLFQETIPDVMLQYGAEASEACKSSIIPFFRCCYNFVYQGNWCDPPKPMNDTYAPAP